MLPEVDAAVLAAMPNVVLTPHIAGSEGLELQAMGENVVNEFALLLSGKPMQYAE